MTARSWQLKRGDALVGTLTREGVDMFWTDCRFEPASAWETVRPLFEASRDAWRRGDKAGAVAADEAIHEADLVLVPGDGGAPITDFLLRISEDGTLSVIAIGRVGSSGIRVRHGSVARGRFADTGHMCRIPAMWDRVAPKAASVIE